jgi:hypothetical protein
VIGRESASFENAIEYWLFTLKIVYLGLDVSTVLIDAVFAGMMNFKSVMGQKSVLFTQIVLLREVNGEQASVPVGHS